MQSSFTPLGEPEPFMSAFQMRWGWMISAATEKQIRVRSGTEVPQIKKYCIVPTSCCAVVGVDVVGCSLTCSFLLLSVVSLPRMFLSNSGFRTLISLPLVALPEPFLVAFPCTCQLNRILTNDLHMELETRNFFLLLTSQQLSLQITVFLHFVFSCVSFSSSF